MGEGHRVLFLSANAGTGHTSAAEAVRKALLLIDSSTTTKIVDSYSQANAFLGRVATQGYIQLVKFLPQIYSFFYELRDRDAAMGLFKSKLTQITARNFRKLMKEFRPDLVVCTHAFPSGIASILKEEFHIRLVCVITDFTVHPFWIHQNADLYLVGDEELADVLRSKKIDPKRIKVTGIPVDPEFSIKEEKNTVRERLGLLPDLETILVMGGGAGLGPIGWILRSLRKVGHPIQVVVVTGVNRGLRKRMEKVAAKLNGAKHGKKTSIKQVKVYGFVDNVHDLMKASDLLITKPGGLTSSEALAAELPIVIVRPLPGQEIRNAHYLIKEKAAVMAKREKNVARVVDQLFSDPKQLAKLRDRARQLKKPKAASEAAHYIMELLQ